MNIARIPVRFGNEPTIPAIVDKETRDALAGTFSEGTPSFTFFGYASEDKISITVGEEGGGGCMAKGGEFNIDRTTGEVSINKSNTHVMGNLSPEVLKQALAGMQAIAKLLGQLY